MKKRLISFLLTAAMILTLVPIFTVSVSAATAITTGWENNSKGVLPEIDGIQSIECLNNGTIQDIQNGTAKYGIQMRITYIKN